MMMMMMMMMMMVVVVVVVVVVVARGCDRLAHFSHPPNQVDHVHS
jgi:hypothetical protein